MSELLDLAGHYYAVANHIEANAREMLRTAEFLFKAADALSEQNMKQVATGTGTDQSSVAPSAEVGADPLPQCFWCGWGKSHASHRYHSPGGHPYRVGPVVTEEERMAYENSI